MWSEVPFGKYKGKTLPQIVLTDPDYFFWAVDGKVFKGSLIAEAEEIARKAQRIKIPNNDKNELTAEYLIHAPTKKFGDLRIVPKSQPLHEGGSPAFRRDYIDLSVVRQIKTYDKTGGKLLIGCVKYIVFGSTDARLTRQRCEKFFDDDKNFL